MPRRAARVEDGAAMTEPLRSAVPSLKSSLLELPLAV
jgi:hypothetical protein